MKKKILFVSVNRHQNNYFAALGKYLAKTYDVTLIDYSLRHYFDTLLPAVKDYPEELTPEVLRKIIRFSQKKGEIRTDFDRFRKFLHTKKQLIKGAKRTFTYFYHYIRNNKIDMVCIWNGNGAERAAVMEAAKAVGVKTVYFENGLLPNTTTMDPEGVNYSGILAHKTSPFFKNIKMASDKLERLFQEQLIPRAQKRKWYQNAKPAKPAPDEVVDLTKPYVFVPFQVHDDTQVIIHSPYLRDMEELTKWVAQAVRQHNETSREKLRIIIKEHPSDSGRTNYSLLKATYPEITFLKAYSTETLIEKAKVVITINSSVGIEALLKHKKVITLGNAAYSIDGIVMRASSTDELALGLDALEAAVDEDLINHFLYYIRYIYSVQGSWRNPSETHLQSVKKRVKDIIDGCFF